MTRLEFAAGLVEQTNKLLSRHFKTLGAGALRLKKNEEIVTAADLVANKFITAQLLKHFPNDDIISEEAEKIDNTGEGAWYVDPLDGTTNFSYGFRDFAVCLAYVKHNKIELGVIGIPLAKEVYYAEHDGGAYLNGTKIKVSSTNNHGTRLMILLCEGHTVESQNIFLRVIKKIDLNTTRFRVFSSAGVELTAVACGRADGYITAGVRPWDVLPGVLLVRTAGGKVTNFKGQDWTLKDTNIIASNGLIHKKLLALAK